MATRNPELDVFLHSLQQGLLDRCQPDSPERQLTDRIFDALREPQPSMSVVPARFPVCDWLDTVADRLESPPEGEESAERVSSSVLEHTHAIINLADRLAWWQRQDASQTGEPFASGHANATLIGSGGLEQNDRVWIGISLMAPNIDYPEHHHPPEEVYLVQSPGQWQQRGGQWHEPGPGGLVHNSPGILHAMRSGDTPLLATWCLWLDQ